MVEAGGASGRAREGAGTLYVLAASVRRAAKGAAEAAYLFPGGIAIVAAYAVTAAALYSGTYANLWGVVAAAGVGASWYVSPLGRLEARRRRRSREAPPGPVADPTGS